MKSKTLRKALLICGITAAAAVAVAAVVLAARPDLRFRVKEMFGVGRGKAVIAKAKEGETSFEEKGLSEFLEQENVSFDDSLLLVNAKYPLNGDEQTDIAEYRDSGVLMDRCIMDGYKQLADEVNDRFGDKLYIMSSYRTAEEQAEIAEEKDSDTAAPENASEHQTGLALDVYVSGFAGDGFLKSDAGQFVNSSCWEYGWIIRYPQGKQDITGIRYEPWHIRWVGFPHSELIYKNSLTLEEYIEFLEKGEFYVFDNYIITRQNIGDTVKIPDDCQSYVVSYDNTGCVIITGKR